MAAFTASLSTGAAVFLTRKKTASGITTIKNKATSLNVSR